MTIRVRTENSHLNMTPKLEYKHWLEAGKLKQKLITKGFMLVDLTEIPF